MNKPEIGKQYGLACAGCGGPIQTTADVIGHAGCHQAGDLAEGERCGHLRPLLRMSGVDLPLIPCVRPAGHAENVHCGADGSEWRDVLPDWWEQANQQVGDILAALVRRTGADQVELADDELARRGPGEAVRFQYDEDGCALVEITTEVPA